MTPAGKQKDKEPTPEEVEAQRLADEEQARIEEDELGIDEDLELEVPAVGEAVTYVTVDPDSGRHEEQAALITYVGETGVDLTAFFRHARAGRPIQNVPFHDGQTELVEETRHFWRYPQAAAVPEIPDPENAES